MAKNMHFEVNRYRRSKESAVRKNTPTRITLRLVLCALLVVLTACAYDSSSSSAKSTSAKRVASRSLVLIDAKTGKMDRNFPNIANADSVVADGKGGWYVGGDFAHVGKVARNGLAHLRSDGSLYPAFAPGLQKGSRVINLVLHRSVIYAIDDYHLDRYVAALDARSGKLLWQVLADDATGLAYGHGVLYVVGSFDHIGGVARDYVAALNPRSGTPTLWTVRDISKIPGYTFGQDLIAVAVAKGVVYLGGDFGRVDGVKRECSLVAVSSRTARPTAWAPKCRGSSLLVGVNAITVTHGQVIVGGSQGSFGVFDARTARHLPWEKGVVDVANAFAVSGNILYLGNAGTGSGEAPLFSRAGGKPVNNLAAVILPKGQFTSWRPNLGRCVTVSDIAVAGGKVLAAGLFSPRSNCS
jgi:outer membrane protein assembly factor BamB